MFTILESREWTLSTSGNIRRRRKTKKKGKSKERFANCLWGCWMAKRQPVDQASQATIKIKDIFVAFVVFNAIWHFCKVDILLLLFDEKIIIVVSEKGFPPHFPFDNFCQGMKIGLFKGQFATSGCSAAATRMLPFLMRFANNIILCYWFLLFQKDRKKRGHSVDGSLKWFAYRFIRNNNNKGLIMWFNELYGDWINFRFLLETFFERIYYLVVSEVIFVYEVFTRW